MGRDWRTRRSASNGWDFSQLPLELRCLNSIGIKILCILPWSQEHHWKLHSVPSDRQCWPCSQGGLVSAARITPRQSSKMKITSKERKLKFCSCLQAISEFSLLFTALFRFKGAAIQLRYMYYKRFKIISTWHTLSLFLKDWRALEKGIPCFLSLIIFAKTEWTSLMWITDQPPWVCDHSRSSWKKFFNKKCLFASVMQRNTCSYLQDSLLAAGKSHELHLSKSHLLYHTNPLCAWQQLSNMLLHS